MLTFFTVPKPFEGHIGDIQYNAIRSWCMLRPICEVVLLGQEEGIATVAEELGIVHIKDITCNKYGTPLLDSVFRLAAEASRFEIMCYINTDIILMSDFLPACDFVRRMDSFLMAGRRWDLDIHGSIDYSKPGWEESLRAAVLEAGRLRPPAWIDYFVFNRSLWNNGIPPFAIGRTSYDNWFIYKAKKQLVQVIDATPSVMAIHQNHPYKREVITKEKGKWKGPEVLYNMELAGKRAVNYNIDDADYLLEDGALKKKSRATRARRFITTHYPSLARLMVRAGRRVRLYPAEETDVVAERTE